MGNAVVSCHIFGVDHVISDLSETFPPQRAHLRKERKLPETVEHYLKAILDIDGVIDAWVSNEATIFVTLKNFRVVCVRSYNLTPVFQCLAEIDHGARSAYSSQKRKDYQKCFGESSVTASLNIEQSCGRHCEQTRSNSAPAAPKKDDEAGDGRRTIHESNTRECKEEGPDSLRRKDVFNNENDLQSIAEYYQDTEIANCLDRFYNYTAKRSEWNGKFQNHEGYVHKICEQGRCTSRVENHLHDKNNTKGTEAKTVRFNNKRERLFIQQAVAYKKKNEANSNAIEMCNIVTGRQKTASRRAKPTKDEFDFPEHRKRTGTETHWTRNHTQNGVESKQGWHSKETGTQLWKPRRKRRIKITRGGNSRPIVLKGANTLGGLPDSEQEFESKFMRQFGAEIQIRKTVSCPVGLENEFRSETSSNESEEQLFRPRTPPYPQRQEDACTVPTSTAAECSQTILQSTSVPCSSDLDMQTLPAITTDMLNRDGKASDTSSCPGFELSGVAFIVDCRKACKDSKTREN